MTRGTMTSAIVCISLLAGGGIAAAQTFPAAGTWLPLTSGGTSIKDDNTSVDEPQCDSYKNVVGGDIDGATNDCTGAGNRAETTGASAYVWSDATYLYFRLRVGGNPGTTSDLQNNAAWGCEIDTNGNPAAYEFIAYVDGHSDSVLLYRNDAKGTGVGAVADTFLKKYTPLATFANVTTAAPGNPTDYFISWAVKRSDGTAGAGIPALTTANIRIWCGTNTSGQPYLTTGTSGDVANYDASDTDNCTATGCTTCNIDNSCGSTCMACMAPNPICTYNAGTLQYVCGKCTLDNQCPMNQVCANGNCIVPECNTDAECLTDTKPICADHICTACAGDGDCRQRDPTEPACLTTGACGECLDSTLHCADDTPTTPWCIGATPNSVSGVCEQCRDSNDCSGTSPICNAEHTCEPCNGNCPNDLKCSQTGACVVCEVNSDCDNPAAPSCVNNACVPCTADGQCVDDSPSFPTCKGDGTCVECADSTDCSLPLGGLVCDTGDNTCQDCLINDDCANPTPICDLAGENTCVICDDTHMCPNGGVCSNGSCHECATSADCNNAAEPICIDFQCAPCSSPDAVGDTQCQLDTPSLEACRADGHCVDCVIDGHCSAPTPACDTAVNMCTECLTDNHCVGNPDGEVCDTSTQQCVECLGPADCSNPTPVCNGSHICEACDSDGDCEQGLLCDEVANGGDGACVACVNSDDCPAAPDAPLPICGPSRTCQACGLEDTSGDAECGAKQNGDYPACVTADGDDLEGHCVLCTATEMSACTDVGSVCETDSHTCVQCVTSSDCWENPDPTYPAGDNTPECSASNTCGACTPGTVGDATCLAKDPAFPACQPGGVANPGECGECRAGNTTACTGDTPECFVEAGLCVQCLTNDDCGGQTPVCDDIVTHTCQAACTEDADCTTADKPVCILASEMGNLGKCTPCATDTPGHQCPVGATPVCKPFDGIYGTCVQCTTNEQCPTGDFCSGEVCVDCLVTPDCPASQFCVNKTCVEDCPNDDACPDGLHCNLTNPNKGECTECVPGAQGQCVEPEPYCAQTGTCEECLTNQNCMDPEQPFCVLGQCVGCTSDDQCSGSKPACQPPTSPQQPIDNPGECGQCSATNDDQCVGGTPVCLVKPGICVECTVGDDCSSGSCNLANNTCNPFMPDAGVAEADGPTLPPDAAVVVTADAAPGTPDAAPGTPDAAVGSPDAPPVVVIDAAPGTPDAKSIDAAVGAADAGARDASSTDAQPIVPKVDGLVEGGGCACRVSGGGTPPAGNAVWFLLGVVGFVLDRRRRRR